MNLPEFFISCDWGTTNFRLRVVNTDSLRVIAEHTTVLGIRELNERFLKSAESDRLPFFAAYLKTQLLALPAAHRTHPIVVSGMASANIGMQDLPYGELPIDAEGTGSSLRT
jgi:2-dehydro-3-deoxygalactonokinase